MTPEFPNDPHTVTLSATVAAHRFTTIAGAVPSANAGGVGVSRVAGVSGDRITCDFGGRVLVEASAAISAGAAIATTNDGSAVTHSTGVKLGIALEAAAADGDLILVGLIPYAI